ncbi:hypothetical protein [Sinorhizobium medicae]|uniref:hypothetical protein n=1 Tax=Sinorhizobium medicae TaxID=110321 RepID=UPI001296CF4E|nr:hypothetical protein [Sinorhizobium medicae]WQP39277.1 hypothetical protein U8C38_06755 [Sinorhizobium medicae]
MTITYTDLIEWAEAQKRQKFTWLEDHGPRSKHPRPETEAENKKRDIAMLDSVLALCRGRVSA